MENRMMKLYSDNTPVPLKVCPGHYIAAHSHLNYYLDMTTLKTRQSEAYEMARALVHQYVSTTVVDTIICLDGTQVIGAFLAEQLSASGFTSINAHQTIYVLSPEYDTNSQIIFRDNMRPMLDGKHILLLMANAITPSAISKSLECVGYYGGIAVGIAAIFSTLTEVEDVHINAVFNKDILPDYQSVPGKDCPLCKNKVHIDALVNGFGYSKL
ncbi:MAG: orotate phosphoribosyltransferase [Pygmaiobacter sp.]